MTFSVECLIASPSQSVWVSSDTQENHPKGAASWNKCFMELQHEGNVVWCGFMSCSRLMWVSNNGVKNVPFANRCPLRLPESSPLTPTHVSLCALSRCTCLWGMQREERSINEKFLFLCVTPFLCHLSSFHIYLFFSVAMCGLSMFEVVPGPNS